MRVCISLVWLLSGTGLFTSCTAPDSKDEVQNVVLILIDDMGCDLSVMGAKGVQTPVADRLSTEGVLFTQAFSTCASCAPTRASILTGMYPHSNGHWRNTITPRLSEPESEFGRSSATLDKVRIPESLQTLPEVLSQSGFFTGITQKFHLSPPWKYPFEGRNPVQNDPEQFKQVITEFITQSGDRPFFIQANIAAPHRPFPAHVKRYKGIPPHPDSIAVPSYLPDNSVMREDLRDYFISVQLADQCTGAVLEAIEASGQAEQTLIIYASDQGPAYHRAKASPYYAGTHVPLIISGPGVQKSTRSDELVSFIDLMPTILRFLRLPDLPQAQGQSLWPILSGRDMTLEGRDYAFMEHNSHGNNPREFYPSRVVTDGRYYLIRNLIPERPHLLPADLAENGKPWYNRSYAATLVAQSSHPLQYQLLMDMLNGKRPEWELYDLETDPAQLNNLAKEATYKTIRTQLEKELEKWRRETGDFDFLKERPYLTTRP